MLTLPGRSFAARMGSSLLSSVGLPELIATSKDDYAALAVRLASQPGALQPLRRRLAAARTTAPLFDTDQFRRHIEAAYEMMLTNHQQAEPS